MPTTVELRIKSLVDESTSVVTFPAFIIGGAGGVMSARGEHGEAFTTLDGGKTWRLVRVERTR